MRGHTNPGAISSINGRIGEPLPNKSDEFVVLCLAEFPLFSTCT